MPPAFRICQLLYPEDNGGFSPNQAIWSRSVRSKFYRPDPPGVSPGVGVFLGRFASGPFERIKVDAIHRLADNRQTRRQDMMLWPAYLNEMDCDGREIPVAEPEPREQVETSLHRIGHIDELMLEIELVFQFRAQRLDAIAFRRMMAGGDKVDFPLCGKMKTAFRRLSAEIGIKPQIRRFLHPGLRPARAPGQAAHPMRSTRQQ